MIVAQVFLEAMEGCHLFLSPFFVMQTRVFRVSPSAIVQISVWPGCKDGLPLISSSGVGSPSRLSSSVSFHSFRRAFAPALQRCSFSSSSQPELLFLAGFLRSFGSCPFSHGSQALFFVLATVVGDFESCPLAVSCEAPSRCSLVSLDRLTNFPFAVTCEALFPLLTGFVGRSFRKLLVCVELRGALPPARLFRWLGFGGLHITAAVLQQLVHGPASFGHFSRVSKGPPLIPFPTTFLHQTLLFRSTYFSERRT